MAKIIFLFFVCQYTMIRKDKYAIPHANVRYLYNTGCNVWCDANTVKWVFFYGHVIFAGGDFDVWHRPTSSFIVFHSF